jgi:hypothetical protein
MSNFPISAKLPDWRGRLRDYLAQVSGAQFRPGRHDCALFTAGAVHAMTGRDLAADWCGKYSTLAAGQAALVAAGYANHLALAAALFPAVAPPLAVAGDLAVLPSDIAGGAGALGVVQGSAVYVLKPSGLAVVSRLHIEAAFFV